MAYKRTIDNLFIFVGLLFQINSIMKKIFYILPLTLFLFSCTDDSANQSATNSEVKQGETRSKLSAGTQTPEELEKIAEEKRAAEKEKLDNQTTMEITPSVYDFGNIAKEKPITKIFTIKNTGNKPLIIQDAQASCGCTVPRKPEQPILPGEEDELEVTFTSNASQSGTAINKTITVTANIPGSTQTVSIKGKVEE